MFGREEVEGPSSHPSWSISIMGLTALKQVPKFWGWFWSSVFKLLFGCSSVFGGKQAVDADDPRTLTEACGCLVRLR